MLTPDQKQHLLAVARRAVIGRVTDDARLGRELEHAVCPEPDASGVFVTGLPVGLTVNQSEASDALVILAGGGIDTVSAITLASGLVGLTLDGGLGYD